MSEADSVASLRKEDLERHLASEEASLPHEPSPDGGNAVNLLVRMPDGSRQGRRFLESHKLQVRPYPRRAFSVDASAATFDELGLSGRQEALFLELL